MRQILAIFRREMRAFSMSTMAPVIGAGFLVLTGLFYYLFVLGYAESSLATVRSGRPVFLNIHAGIFHRLYGDMVLFLVFLLPAVTMRLLSSEYRSGRYDLIASWPVSEWSWVVGKWMSAVAVAKALLLGALFYFVVTWLLGGLTNPPVHPDWQPMLTSFVGLVLLSCAVCAWGVFASALVSHQAAAYFLGFAIGLGLFLVGQFEVFLPGALGVAAGQLALGEHFLRFAGGVIDSRDVVYFLGVTAVGLAAAVAAMTQRRLPTVRRGRPWLTVLVVMAVVVFLQVVAARRPLRVDLTPDRLYSLAPQTEQILQSLEKDRKSADGSVMAPPAVEILAFYQRLDGARQGMQALLRSFDDQTGQLSFRLLDPDTEPELIREYGINVARSVVVVCEDRHRLLLEPDEGQLASAVFRVANDTRPAVYWLIGHGEARIDLGETGGASQLAGQLVDTGYDIRPLALGERLSIPPDAAALIWAGPKLNPSAEVLDLLADYVDAGGAMACFFGPDSPPAVQDWTLQYNVQQNDDVVVSPNRSSALAGVGLRTVTVSSNYGNHRIVRSMEAVATTFPLVQTLRSVSAEMPDIEGVIILLTVPDSWGETDLETRYSGVPSYDPALDRVGPKPFGVAMQIDRAEGPEAPRGRMVVIGSSAFITNANIGLYGNRDLALNIVSWLVQEEDLVGIRGRRASYQPLLLEDGTKDVLGWVSVLGWPGLIGLGWFGLVILRQRRH